MFGTSVPSLLSRLRTPDHVSNAPCSRQQAIVAPSTTPPPDRSRRASRPRTPTALSAGTGAPDKCPVRLRRQQAIRASTQPHHQQQPATSARLPSTSARLRSWHQNPPALSHDHQSECACSFFSHSSCLPLGSRARRPAYNMSLRRSLSFPRFGSARKSVASSTATATTTTATMASSESPCQHTPAHSRDSSSASGTSSPVTSTCSNRGHSRWPSSTSSLVPDSPANAAKPPLQDLVEDPAERDDDLSDLPSDPAEPFCICTRSDTLDVNDSCAD